MTCFALFPPGIDGDYDRRLSFVVMLYESVFRTLCDGAAVIWRDEDVSSKWQTSALLRTSKWKWERPVIGTVWSIFSNRCETRSDEYSTFARNTRQSCVLTLVENSSPSWYRISTVITRQSTKRKFMCVCRVKLRAKETGTVREEHLLYELRMTYDAFM